MFKSIMLLVAIFGLMSGYALAAGINVAFNTDVTVQGPQLSLGDIATVTGDDAEKVRAVRELNLGNAPLPGNKLVFTAEMISSRLTDSGARRYDVAWQIPPIISISTAGQALSGENLQAMAVEAIKERLSSIVGGELGDITVSPSGASHDIIVPLGNLSYKIDFPGGIRLGVPTGVNIAIAADARNFTTINLKFDVKVYRNIIVAARNIAAFEKLEPQNLRLERRDISRLSGYVTNQEKLTGKLTRRSLAAGMPVCEAALSQVPVVKRGGSVTILVRIDDITVSASGKALQDGAVGTMIRVQNVNTNKVVVAKVVDNSTVEVIIYSGR